MQIEVASCSAGFRFLWTEDQKAEQLCDTTAGDQNPRKISVLQDPFGIEIGLYSEEQGQQHDNSLILLHFTTIYALN